MSREMSASTSGLTRRAAIAALMPGALLPVPVWAQQGLDARHASDFWHRPRQLRLRHISGEQIDSTYWSDGQYIESAALELSWFMRDRVADRAVYMHPVVLDIAFGVCGWLDYYGIRQPLVLTSGHRDRQRNARIEGAVRNSLHITGEAMDVRIPGVSSLQLARFGVWLGGGGVGWYPSKEFTHMDRGRLRAWQG